MKHTVATIGMFDGVHLGHRDLLRHLADEAKERNGHSLVVTFSNHPLSVIKPEIAPKLILSPDEKRKKLFDCDIETVAILDFTDKIRSMTARQYMRLLRDKYDVDTIILGFNNRFGSDTNLTFDDYVNIGKEEGITFIRENEYFVSGNTVNSSVIRKYITDGDIETANKLLGYDFHITGTVVYGKQLGRTIGFPTANINTDFADKIIPAKGVYACYATLGGNKRFPAMVNIGHRPTIDNFNSPISIEAHIIGVSKKLYGEQMTISFAKFLRHEIKFKSLEQLRDQLEQDKIQAIKLLEF